MNVEQQSDHTLSTPSAMGLLVCGAGSHPSCHPGVNLNRYSGSRSCIPWHSDNESLFAPQNQPKLIVSMSSGNSVEFQPRRVLPLIRLDHGDTLVMYGLAQSEYEHRTVSGLQGPRVNPTYRWITQHIASCPLTGAMCSTFPSCARFSQAGSPRGGHRGAKMGIYLSNGLP